MQPPNEEFFTLFSKASSNVVESAAMLMEFAAVPHERWAELAKRMHDTEHAGDDALDHVPVITERPRLLPIRRRRQRLDPRPLLIGENPFTRHVHTKSAAAHRT